MLGENAGDRAVDFYNGDQPIVTREPEHDMGGDWAWRYAPERCDETCHHPMHAFGDGSRGVGHLTWFRPGSPGLTPVPEATGEEHRCVECGEAIRLDTAGPDAGILAGASVWAHERFYPFGMEPHEPRPGSTEQETADV